jgi:hypothetical protein
LETSPDSGLVARLESRSRSEFNSLWPIPCSSENREFFYPNREFRPPGRELAAARVVRQAARVPPSLQTATQRLQQFGGRGVFRNASHVEPLLSSEEWVLMGKATPPGVRYPLVGA